MDFALVTVLIKEFLMKCLSFNNNNNRPLLPYENLTSMELLFYCCRMILTLLGMQKSCRHSSIF